MKKVEFGHTLTPVVCIFANREGKLLDAPHDLDLKEAPKGMLEGVISDSELYHFIHNINVDPAIFLQENAEKEDVSQENAE